MKKHAFHIAQANIALVRAPLTDPVMRGFVAKLDYINALVHLPTMQQDSFGDFKVRFMKGVISAVGLILIPRRRRPT